MVAISANEMAHQTGVGETFVGTSLLAVITSLPELIVSLAALRLGAYDLAVGNLFGSDAANMSVLLVVDIAYTRGPILAAVDPAQTVAAVGAILLMALALSAIVHGFATRVRRLEPDGVIVLVAYVLVLVAVAARA